MAEWHRLGSKDELLAHAPFSIKIDRHRIALFLHQGRLTAISDICNGFTKALERYTHECVEQH